MSNIWLVRQAICGSYFVAQMTGKGGGGGGQSVGASSGIRLMITFPGGYFGAQTKH